MNGIFGEQPEHFRPLEQRGPADAHDVLPRLVDVIEGLEPAEIERGLWSDELLTLGGRLRAIYGNDVELDRVAVAYAVSIGRDLTVMLNCAGSDRAATVRAACAVCEISPDAIGIWQFALRENAQMRLARLAYDGATLWCEYELLLAAALVPVLQAAVTAVAGAARTLRGELATMQAYDWRRAA